MHQKQNVLYFQPHYIWVKIHLQLLLHIVQTCLGSRQQSCETLVCILCLHVYTAEILILNFMRQAKQHRSDAEIKIFLHRRMYRKALKEKMTFFEQNSLSPTSCAKSTLVAVSLLCVQDFLYTVMILFRCLLHSPVCLFLCCEPLI